MKLPSSTIIHATYTLGHPLQEFQDLSHVLGGKIAKNKWTYDNEYIKGYMEYFQLDDGLILYLYETLAIQPISVTRLPNEKEHYFIINFDISGISISINHGSPLNDFGANTFDGILLASSETKATFIWPLKLQTGVKLILSETWMKRYFDHTIENERNLLEILLNQNTPIYLYELMDTASMDVIKNIYKNQKANSLTKIQFHYLTLNLVQLFFSKILNREQKINRKFHQVDLVNMFKARDLLVSDFENGCPLVRDLAKTASMSERKFHELFKQVFGQTMHKYYQRCRMQKAMQLLQSGKFNISTIALKVGYQHSGKFSEAFFVEFGCKPKSIKM